MVALPIDSYPGADTPDRPRRAVRIWLGILIVLVFAMVLVGGATRLTESGLSITEWKPVAGALPPLSEEVWKAEFELYKASSQYELLNAGMSLEQFKTIYWWEWAHRELGRFIGVVYIIGFLWFAIQQNLRRRDVAILAGMGLLLGLQGLAGWIMVASGLEPGMTAVAPVKLALHLTLACLFFAALVAMFVRLGGAPREAAEGGTVAAARILVVLAFVQIALGGLVAGHDAGLTYNTWPLMDGRFVPTGLALLEPGWLNLVDNVTTIQFNHRIGAYILAAAVLAYAIVARRESREARARAWLMTTLVLAQVGVGVATLLHVVPMGLALAHQGVALVMLLTIVWNASVLRPSGAQVLHSPDEALA
jgi:cytochrome c oxidase assembly protein subunit 15